MKKLGVILLIFTFLNALSLPLYAYTLMPQFLCESGIKFYQQGKYDAALGEFQRALMIDPNYAPALKYIYMIEQIRDNKEAFIPYSFTPTATTPKGMMDESLDLIEIQREMLTGRQLLAQETSLLPTGVSQPAILPLDESITRLSQPIEIEQGKSIIIIGKNIQRFLVTQPDVISVEEKSPDELLVTVKDVGYTYLHIWDDNGRWTIELSGIYLKPKEPSHAELLRQEEEKASHFKLRYTLDWSSYETGRRIRTLERSSYAWGHSLELKGETPYGNIDSLATIRRLKTTTDLTYLTLGLTEGKIGPFKGFTLRGFDYFPLISNLTFPGVTIRGAMLASSAFNDKLNYTAFWGREGGGRYGNLSPSLVKTKDSFLEGANIKFSPTQKQNYEATAVRGRGRDRESYLHDYNYDLASSWEFKNWGLGYELAYDTQTFAYIVNTHRRRPGISLSAEFRNINKNFYSSTGRGWRAGEFGGLFSLRSKPTEELVMNSSLDVYLDRFYPAEDNNDRWNEDFNWDARYQISPATSLTLSYMLQNQLGRISQYRYQSPGLGLSQRFRFLRDIYTSVNLARQESKNFSSPSSDYINDQLSTGIRFNLIGELYAYANKEFNWVQERYYARLAKPNAFESGVDWTGQFGPFSGTLRATFRDEEDTVSNLSFLSGEDYIEGYSELTYRPTDDKEIYGSCRVRNVWAENPAVSKRMEVSFNAGMRYLWDTGVRWESVGNIEGYVFKDLNSDGLRQRDEAPMEGIKLWLGKDKSAVTDLFGYYKFKGVKARKAYVNLDTSTLPSAFVLTVPVIQEVAIAHHHTARVDFGVICRSEISGVVFEDIDGDGEYGKDDKGIQGVVIVLEDVAKAVTDGAGRYSFPNAPVGEHAVNLDLNSLPVYFLPKTTLSKEITLFEGVTYIYNIPLKKIQE